MIRLPLFLIVMAGCLAIVAAELYGILWLAAHAIAWGTRHPFLLIGLAAALFSVTRRVVADGRRRRSAWRAAFFREEVR